MGRKLRDLIDQIESLAPPGLAEPWDNSGLQVGSPDQPIARVLVAVDVTKQVIREAARKNVDALVTHHPVLFDSVATLRPDRWPGCVVVPLMAQGRSLYVAHTNLDVAASTNTSAALLRKLGADDALALDAPVQVENSPQPGIGALWVCEPTSLSDLAGLVSERLGTMTVRVADAGRGRVSRIVAIAGSARGLHHRAAEAGADALIGGEIGHHMALEAAATGLSCIETGHFASERPGVEHLAALLDEAVGDELEIVVAEDRAGVLRPA